MKRTFITTLLFCLISITTVFAAQTGCPEHFANGQAPDFITQNLATKTKELCNSGFAVLHSAITKTPVYASEHLTRERLMQGKGLKRQSKFHPDDRLSHADRAELSDYAHSEFDRSHIAPSGDMFDIQSQHETFALSNMVPQLSSLNRGVWNQIESGVRRIAKSKGELYVVTGPLFRGSDVKQIGRVMIPSATFKAVYDPSRQEAGAYVVENVEGAKAQVITNQQLDTQSGINVFPLISDQIKENGMKLPVPKARKRRGKR